MFVSRFGDVANVIGRHAMNAHVDEISRRDVRVAERAEFTRDMRDLGVKDLSSDQLVAMRIHGVDTLYVRELRDLGYNGLSSEDLVAMRIHGVSTCFIRELKDAGYEKIPVDKLVEMRIHGISAEDVKRMK